VSLRTSLRGSRGRRAFSIVDLLVSMAVITVLIGLLMPTLRTVRETARRVICGSNVRQLGIGIALFADDNRDRLPPTQFLGKAKNQEMLRVRVDNEADPVSDSNWDGLGWLYGRSYLPEPHLFYCPSHAGVNTFAAFADRWWNNYGSILSNYQFRGSDAKGQTSLSLVDPSFTALIADGLRTRSDFNHKIGGNVLRADLSVYWFRDSSGHVMDALPLSEGNNGATDAAWNLLDTELSR
jgi:competence protein ComGC